MMRPIRQASGQLLILPSSQVAAHQQALALVVGQVLGGCHVALRDARAAHLLRVCRPLIPESSQVRQEGGRAGNVMRQVGWEY